MELVSYEQLRAQYSRKSAVELEADQEEKNLLICKISYRESCSTATGQEKSTRLVRQLKSWRESLTEQERNNLFLFINIDEAVTRFINHLTNKYSGAKKKEQEQLLSSPGIENDIKNLLTVLIYEHKAWLEQKGLQAFFSPQAHCEISKYIMLKNNRSFIHEARGAAVKTVNSSQHLPPAEMLATIERIIESKLEKHVRQNMPARIADVDHGLKLLNC